MEFNLSFDQSIHIQKFIFKTLGKTYRFSASLASVQLSQRTCLATDLRMFAIQTPLEQKAGQFAKSLENSIFMRTSLFTLLHGLQLLHPVGPFAFLWFPTPPHHQRNEEAANKCGVLYL